MSLQRHINKFEWVNEYKCAAGVARSCEWMYQCVVIGAGAVQHKLVHMFHMIEINK